MQVEDILSVMTQEVYERLLSAVELGKWQNGVSLTAEQREQCLQAVMLWQSRHNEEADHMTVGTDGQIVHVSKQEFKQRLSEQNKIDVTLLED